MLLEEATAIINAPEPGYMVRFYAMDKDRAVPDVFPDPARESLLTDLETAKDLAVRFAARARRRYFNIQVVDADYMPVDGVIYNVSANYE